VLPHRNPQISRSRPSRSGKRALAGLAAVSVAVLLGPGALGAPAVSSAASAAAVTDPLPLDVPTPVRVSSFNMLGYGHTVRGGTHPRFTDGITRTGYAVQIIRHNALQVIGFQEMQPPQFRRFKQLTGDQFGVFPGDTMTTASMANSIAWDQTQWQLLDAETVQIPYFDGHLIRMPYVLLQNLQTGRKAWFFNSHNPANAHGPAQVWRNKAVRREIALFNQLQTDYPTTPVFSTGDENDRSRYFCPMVEQSTMRASNGGGLVGGQCVLPDVTNVDWIMGSPLVDFTSHTSLFTSLVRKATDHHVIIADAVLPSEAVAATRTTHVVVLTLDGLTAQGLQAAGAAGTAPHLQRMVTGGASTLNARTEVESTARIPTLAGMLTGRPVDPANGGTGVGWPGAQRGPVAASAGHYVWSMFDVVHDFGRSTAFYASRPGVDPIAMSWDARYGGLDPFGLDNGRAKIDRYVRTPGDGDAVDALVARLAGRPPALTVAQLVGLAAVGQKSGFRGAKYASAITGIDRLVGRVQSAIAHNPRLTGHTLLVVTANRGGSRHRGDPATIPAVYRVPLLVTGPGVLAGGDLYAMNRGYTDPGTANPGYTSGNPIRNTFVANLVTKMLGLPAVPGSRMGNAQDLTVLAPLVP
jgi:hypothetical protein